jgi:enediyne biosynthesis protein E7
MDASNPAPKPPRAAPYDVGSTDDSLPRMVQDFAALGDTYCVHAPGRKRDSYVLTNPQDIKRVLLTNHRNYTKGVGFDRIKLLLGNGIIVSDGAFWQRQRRMLQPAFQRANIERTGSMIAALNEQRLVRWEQLGFSGEPLNLTKEMSELALDIVLRALFGADIDQLIADVGHNPFSLVTEEPTRDLKFAYRFRQLSKHVETIITRRQQTANVSTDDWLGMMLAARDPTTGVAMTLRELLDEVFSLIVAGHETTAGTLNSAWYLLSQHPDAEATLHAELDAASGLTDWPLAAVEALHYTQQVLLEALRLYPPVWVFTRIAAKEDQVTDYTLPADSDVFVCPYVVHRHPEHWPEPEKFCPERFAADADPKPPRFAYLPFSAGPRHCIGETFAMYEMGIHLYLAARRFRLRYSGAPPVFEARINLRTRDDLQMQVQLRHTR